MIITKLLIVLLSFVSFFLAEYAEAEQTIPHYDLAVSFDTANNLLKGSARITFPDKTKRDISTGELNILSVTLNGKPVAFQIKEGVFPFEGQGDLEIEYQAVFKENAEQEHLLRIDPIPCNGINARRILLTYQWFPEIRDLALYRLHALVPEGFLAVSSAEEIVIAKKAQGTEYSFNFPYPSQHLSLVAGKYREIRENWKGVALYFYVLPENMHLLKSYSEDTKKYLTAYEKLLAPYPYKRLSVVEGFQMESYAMPTVAIIGRDNRPFAFPADSSFRRSMLCQWFGQSVYIGSSQGNWVDGLTAYLADQRIGEQNGIGRDFRKQILINYMNYVNPGGEYALMDYRGAVDLSSKATGLGKGAMFFHMLKKLVGEDTFYLTLQTIAREHRFKSLSWDNLRAVFEQISGDDLSWFFHQWVTRKGVPSIEVRDLKVIMKKGVPTIMFDISQQDEPYRLSLPVRITTDRENRREVLSLQKETEHFEITVKGTPAEITFDEEYEVMRKITPEEYPPVIAALFGSEQRIFVLSEGDRIRYGGIVDTLSGEGFIIKEHQAVRDEDIRKSSLLVLGYDSPVLKRLFGKSEKPGAGASLSVRKNPLNPAKVIVTASGGSGEDAVRSVEDIFRYGEYSFVRFEKGNAREKKTASSENGIAYSLDEPVLVIQPQKAKNLKDILSSLIQVPIVYVGERHTNYEDHRVQLKIIQYLHEKGRKFAIGMEMFQQLFQKSIDKYLNGTLNEREFLKQTGYYKRWQYDYNQYREIVEYAKAKGIPVVALNIRSEIIQKVAANGMDSLSDTERKEIPESMDMSDEEYRERLEKIFETHKHQGNRSFENFYQSQILWDETMAHTIDRYMSEHPEQQMVVLAGVGHILYGSGIPQRTHRLNSKKYTVVAPNAGDIERDAGNFIVFAEQQEPPLTMKLGVVIRKTEEGLSIDQVVPRSIAKAAGVKEGDILVALDDWKIEDIEDIKIFMSDKKRGDTIKITVLRKKFLSGYKPLELTITI